MSYAIYLKIYLLSCTVIQAISYNNSLISPFKHVTVSNTTVYISGEGGIVALHRANQSAINVNTTFKNNWLLLHSKGGVIQCNAGVADISYCRKLNAELSDVTESSINITVDITNLPVYTTAHIPQISKDIFIVGSTSLKIWNTSYGIASFDSNDLSLFLTKKYDRGPMNIEIEGNNSLIFKSSFVHETFVYFLFQEFNKNGNFSSSRLGKMCINYNRNNTERGYYHSYEDIKINCMRNERRYDKVEYAVSTEDFILITFIDVTGSLMCKYNWTEIEDTFTTSRKRTLKCGEKPSVSQYFKLETSNHEYCFDEGKWCNNSTMNCYEVEEKFCNKEYHHTIIGTEILTNGTPVHYTKSKILTMCIREQSNYSEVFVGTDDGFIGMVYMKNFSKPAQFFSIDRGSVMHIFAESEDLYVITENKYEMLNFENCTLHKSCEQCLLNTKCGWDYHEKRCHSNYTESWWWIPATEGFCAQLLDLPQKEVIDTGKDNEFGFNLSLPTRMSGQDTKSMKCGIGDSAKGLSYSPSSLHCMINISKLSAGFYKFWIRLKNISIAEEDIELIRCDPNITCKECVKTVLCSFRATFMDCHKGDFGITVEEKCPSMTSISPILLPYTMTPINIIANIDGFLSNKVLESEFLCELKMGDLVINSSVILNEKKTSLICQSLRISTAGRFKVRLKYRGFYADNNNISMEVYDCSELENECGKCINLKEDGYNCSWCEVNNTCYNPDTDTCNDNSPIICNISVTKIYPKSGPINGGTLVTIEGTNLGTANYNISVFINDTECTINEVEKYAILRCRTGKVSGENVKSKIAITAINTTYLFQQGPYFMYKKLHGTNYDFKPTNATLFGGKTIDINGRNIGFMGSDRYRLLFCNDMECIGCSILNNATKENQIKCKTGKSSKEQNMTYLSIEIDTNTAIKIRKIFKYLPDPNITLPGGTKAQEGGGSTFNITGEGFYNVGEITVDRVEEKCEVPDDNTAVCKTPEFEGGSPNQTVYVHFDGITASITIYYVPNPRFEKFGGILDYDDPQAAITIRGNDILNGAKKEDYKVDIGMDGKCLINTITMTAIDCYPPKNVPRTNNTDPDVVYVIVEGGNLRTYIGDLRYGEKKNYLVIVVGVLAAALVATVVIGVITVLTLKKKKRKAIKAFKMELLSREEMIRKASREEFAEAQMTIRDIKSDLVTTKVPYCDYQQYVFHILFPNQDIKTHPLLLASRVTDDSKIKMQKAMEMLDKLLTNKKFLESLVQTLDRLNKLTMQEKAHFASLLSIALTGNMRLFFNLVNSLLIETIHSGSKRQNKVLFRRFESISQRLMAHWLQIVLYTQLKTQSGLQLFMLYRAVQTVIEKAPVDALTSNSRNTLAEEKLLKMRVEFDSLTLQIDLNGNSDQHYPVKVLDCDTISQVKQKCVEQIYKNRPASDIPHNDELSLEWRIGKGGKHILEDEDTISDRNNGLVRLNTLKHYMVKDNSQMALMYKEHIVEDVYENQSHQLESVTSDDINLVVPGEGDEQAGNTLKWHLESCASNLPDDEKSNREQDIGDIFLNRLFHTKLLLSDYIEIAFEGLMDPQSLSVPIRYFLCMLDKLGKENDIEPDVIQIWKSECYATRLWGPLIGKPQIIFDVDVPAHVEPCMDILKQVFVECFTQTAHKVNKESPPQKLLFHKDIPQYRKRIEPFFIRVEPVDDQTFWGALDEISTSQKNEMKFSRQATLQQLYNLFIAKYSTEIIDDFLDMEESKDLGFGNKLEEVIELMEESATD